MMIEIKNVELLKLQDITIGEAVATKQELAELKPEQIAPLPIYLRVGKVHYRIGDINTIRVGGNAITGDLLIQLKGRMEMKVEGGTIRPSAYVFELARP